MSKKRKYKIILYENQKRVKLFYQTVSLSAVRDKWLELKGEKVPPFTKEYGGKRGKKLFYELGLIYDVKVKDDKAKIIMTLTTPNCPVAESLPQEVKDSAMQVEGIEKVDLDLVFEPPWEKSMMSEAAKLELNL